MDGKQISRDYESQDSLAYRQAIDTDHKLVRDQISAKLTRFLQYKATGDTANLLPARNELDWLVGHYTRKTGISDHSSRYFLYSGFDPDQAQLKIELDSLIKSLDAIVGKIDFSELELRLDTIKDKAADMVAHYIDNIFPNKFKAQVVACSREAAVRYKDALEEALREQISVLEKENRANVDLETLKELEVAVIISANNNDLPHLRPYTNEQYHDESIDRFKLSFGRQEEEDLDGNVGIIVVTEMLLTGFDAPVEQVRRSFAHRHQIADGHVLNVKWCYLDWSALYGDRSLATMFLGKPFPPVLR